MPSINGAKLLQDMGSAAAHAAGQQWPGIRDAAKDELQKLVTIGVQIEVKRKTGVITEDEAKDLVDMQKNASIAVLAGLEGMGLLAAEAVINAALGVLSAAVNAATGFAIL